MTFNLRIPPDLWLPDSPHSERMLVLGRRFGLTQGTQGDVLGRKAREQAANMDVALRIRISEINDKINTWAFARFKSGVGLPMDQLLRYYFLEFLSRLTQHGPHALPPAFNTVEAFFYLNERFLSFDLRPECDFLLRVEDFFDWYHDCQHVLPFSAIAGSLREGQIHSYNFTNDSGGYRLRAGAYNCAFAGFSVIRHRGELSCILLAGQRPTDGRGVDLTEYKNVEMEPYPGKESLSLSSSWGPEDAFLETFPGYQRIVALARFDLNAHKYDVRYINLDIGNCFLVLTDDPDVYSRERDRDRKRLAMEEGLDEYRDLFAALSTIAFVPLFVAGNPSAVQKRRFATSLSTLPPKKRRAFAKEARECLTRDEYNFHGVVNCVVSGNATEATRLAVSPPELEFGTKGYWRPLSPLAIGEDAEGNPTVGKTWVSRTESWKSQEPSEFLLKRVEDIRCGPDPGSVYVLRSPAQQREVYKIGLTRRDATKRAAELSSTAAPLRFEVLAEWAVGDCGNIEKEIHGRLQAYRINPKREFFAAPLTLIIKTVQDLIEEEER